MPGVWRGLGAGHGAGRGAGHGAGHGTECGVGCGAWCGAGHGTGHGGWLWVGVGPWGKSGVCVGSGVVAAKGCILEGLCQQPHTVLMEMDSIVHVAKTDEGVMCQVYVGEGSTFSADFCVDPVDDVQGCVVAWKQC